jgi:branched-subunit amino acid transport protein AzlD
MTDRQYVLTVIVAMGLVTLVLRALPFVTAKWLQKYATVQRLGQFLPLAIMTLLLVHTMAGAAREHAQGPWPELLAAACVVLVQWRTRNALWSMLLGTGSYVWMRHGL